jgi:hypothetical protein
MPLFLGDPTIILLIPALIFAFWAQGLVKSTYNKYSKIANRKGLTGADVARRLLSENRVYEVNVEQTQGRLTDNYNPKTKILSLSEAVYSGTSIAALGIAAHETGHAIQHSSGYAALNLRTAIYPVSAFGSNLALPLFFVGMFFFHSKTMMDIGIILYIGALAFTLITLPVEFNASARAVTILAEGGYLKDEELTGARKVLNAAAMTYVAATAMAAVQLLRMLFLRDRE